MTLFVEIAAALASVFAVVGLGAVVRRVGWLDDAAEKSLLGLLVKLFLPALVLGTLLAGPPRRGSALIEAPLAGAAVALLGFGSAYALAMLPHALTGLVDASERRTFALGAGLGNYAYLAIPVASALVGPQVLPTLLLFNLGVELVLWSVGLRLLPGAQLGWRGMLNAPLVALVLGLLLDLAGLAPLIPRPALQAVEMIGRAAVPLGLMAVGAALGVDLGRPRWAPVAWAGLVRFAVLPAAVAALVAVIPLSDALTRVVLIQAAMPAAVAPVMLARLYGGAPGLAARLTLGTSIAAIAALPLVVAGYRAFGLLD